MSGVAANGETTPFGTGRGAHYLSVRHVCEAEAPLTYMPVSTVHVTNGRFHVRQPDQHHQRAVYA